MKKALLTSIILIGMIQSLLAQDPLSRDFSGTYTLWRAPSTNMKKIVKDGIKVQCSQKGKALNLYHDFKNYANDRLDFGYTSEEYEISIEKLTNARMGFGGWPDWNTGRYYVEVEEGVLAFFEGNPNNTNSGECSEGACKEITFVLYNKPDVAKSLDEKKLKAKVNSMLIETCKIMKEKNPQKKDIRGLNNIPESAVTDFSKGKKIEGKFYVWRNDQSALRNTYQMGQEVELQDFGDHIDINGKLMKIKKFKTIWDNDQKYAKIETLTGKKVLKANAANGNDGLALEYNYFVEIEEGVIALVREIGYNYFTKSEPCNAKVDNIDYILYKDKSACENSQLGQVKTKLKATLDEMCSKYVATLEGPKSSLPLVLPEKKNTDADVEKMSWDAVKAFYKKQNWNEELIGCYVASADWSVRTEKKLINGTFKDIVISRYKSGVVFYKTSTGIYYCRGIAFAQDVVPGHLDGKLFQTKTLYCPGILDAGAQPGTEYSMQILTKEEAMKFKK